MQEKSWRLNYLRIYAWGDEAAVFPSAGWESAARRMLADQRAQPGMEAALGFARRRLPRTAAKARPDDRIAERGDSDQMHQRFGIGAVGRRARRRGGHTAG